MNELTVGPGGCCAMTKRRGVLRHCKQLAIYEVDGRPYCYYHNPANPKKFGEGYLSYRRDREEGRRRDCR